MDDGALRGGAAPPHHVAHLARHHVCQRRLTGQVPKWREFRVGQQVDLCLGHGPSGAKLWVKAEVTDVESSGKDTRGVDEVLLKTDSDTMRRMPVDSESVCQLHTHTTCPRKQRTKPRLTKKAAPVKTVVRQTSLQQVFVHVATAHNNSGMNALHYAARNGAGYDVFKSLIGPVGAHSEALCAALRVCTRACPCPVSFLVLPTLRQEARAAQQPNSSPIRSSQVTICQRTTYPAGLSSKRS